MPPLFFFSPPSKEMDRVLVGLGTGKCLADAMRLFNYERAKRSRHIEIDKTELEKMESVLEEYKESFRVICAKFGLDKVPFDETDKDSELLDPIAALLRDKRFMSEEAMRKLRSR